MINKISKLSMKRKLLLLFIVLTSFVLVVVLALSIGYSLAESKRNINKVLDVVGSIIAERSVASIAFSDAESANSNLATLAADKTIEYACIRTSEGEVFAEYTTGSGMNFNCKPFTGGRWEIQEGNHLYSIRPVILEDVAIGSVEIVASMDEFNQGVIRVLQNSVLVFLVMIGLASYSAIRILEFIVAPIMKIKDVAQEVTRSKDYSIRMQGAYSDEIGVLIVAINNMLEQIQARDDALIKEKEKAEASAKKAEMHADETQSVNKELQGEIKERARIEEELQELNETLERKVRERTFELQELNEKIGDIARNAGMAEVASGVLHNVGNVLNSVNVSVSMLRDKIKKSKSVNIEKIAEMLQEHENEIEHFICEDEKGRQLPKFIMLLAEQMKSEREDFHNELDGLSGNIDHIKNVISMQQSYAGNYGVREKLVLTDLVEDALKINNEGIAKRGIKVVKEYEEIPGLYVDKHKVLQVLINIISNAKYALMDSDHREKTITIRVGKEKGAIVLEVKDNGVGIEKEDLKQLFQYGFKRRKGGHGYGLHHSALVANELGGKITVESDGSGKGASFKFILPVDAISDELKSNA